MKGVKAFNKGLKCRDLQYEENKTFETSEQIKPCDSGFHFCKEEHAISVLNYYSPNSEFAKVEAVGEIMEHEDKVVTNKINIGCKIKLGDLFKIQFDFIRSKVTELCGKSTEANTSGDYAHANTSGYNSISCSLGIHSKSKAVKGWIIVVDWIFDNDFKEWRIKNIHSSKVGGQINGVTIEPDTWYWFEKGELKLIKD